MIFVGGDDYAEIESLLWLFAVLGTLLSMLQLLVYSVLARQGTRSAYLVWVGAWSPWSSAARWLDSAGRAAASRSP